MYDVELEGIFNNYAATFVKEPDFCIRFYEENELKLSSSVWFDADSLLKYETIAGWYLWALLQNKKHSKAVQKGKAIVSIVEKNIQNLKIDPANDAYYHALINQTAIAKHFRYMYRPAFKDFTLLLQYEPQNKDYKLWADMSKYRSYNILLYCIAFLIIVGNGYCKKYLSQPIAIATPIIGLVCVCYAMWFEVKARRIWKAAKTH